MIFLVTFHKNLPYYSVVGFVEWLLSLVYLVPLGNFLGGDITFVKEEAKNIGQLLSFNAD